MPILAQQQPLWDIAELTHDVLIVKTSIPNMPFILMSSTRANLPEIREAVSLLINSAQIQLSCSTFINHCASGAKGEFWNQSPWNLRGEYYPEVASVLPGKGKQVGEICFL